MRPSSIYLNGKRGFSAFAMRKQIFPRKPPIVDFCSLILNVLIPTLLTTLTDRVTMFVELGHVKGLQLEVGPALMWRVIIWYDCTVYIVEKK